MIPILKKRVFNSTISFEIIGFLTEAHQCFATEERNGIFELSFEYPVTGQLFDELKVDRIVEAKPNDKDDIQKFKIFEITKPISGIVTVNCEHISYELKNYPVKAANLSAAAPHIQIGQILDLAKNYVSLQNSDISLYHSVQTGRAATHSVKFDTTNVRSALGGIEGSILDTFGGEFKFNNFDIYLYENRGEDTGIIISHKKNLTDIKITTSGETSYTKLFPYAKKEDVTITLPDPGTIDVTNNSGISERVLIKDFTDVFGEDEEFNTTNLQTHAESFLSSHNINELDVSMSVSFVNLWQTEEYKEYAPLEKVGLCDVVRIIHQPLNIDTKLKVIKTVYDVIAERYSKIELGSAKSNLSSTIAGIKYETTKKVEMGFSQITAEYLQAIHDAANLITGVDGGNVVLNTNENGKPFEILIMDADSTATATKVWRFNLNGLGYSNSGYSSQTYLPALTMDGSIVADRITTGTLTANIIRAGILSSAYGDSYFNLESGLIHTANAEIVGGSISIGGGTFKTVIQDGSIAQHLTSGTTPLGGLIPVGSGSNYYECIYASKLSSSKGVSLAYENSDGTFSMVGEFGKTDVKINKTTYIGAGLHVNNSIITGEAANNDAYTALKHFRTHAFGGSGTTPYTATIYFGCGNILQQPTATIEVKGLFSGEESLARLDIFKSAGEAAICIRGSSSDGSSKILELGRSIWWGGSDLIARIENLENAVFA